jgi:hypothetical protein
MGYFVKNRRLQSGSSGVVLPTGTSSQRPDNPTFGLIRYNTDSSGFIEFFNGTQYVALSTGDVEYTVDNFVGDGSTTIFTMSLTESTATQIMVFVGSIYQDPATSYTVDGGLDITFTSAPPNTVPINVIHTSS